MSRLLTVFSFLFLVPSFTFGVSSLPMSKPAESHATQPADNVLREAMTAVNSLSKKEKRQKLKAVKEQVKAFKARKAAGEDISTNTLLLILIAILVPPLAVYLYEGEITTRFWISLLLTILGFVLFGSFGAIFLGSLLGIIYSLFVILS